MRQRKSSSWMEIRHEAAAVAAAGVQHALAGLQAQLGEDQVHLVGLQQIERIALVEHVSTGIDAGAPEHGHHHVVAHVVVV
ncbi:MAG TPA: hypothetical protein VF993_14620, partial [Myxococcales bacterium]